MSNETQFCERCGQRLVNGVCPNCDPQYANSAYPGNPAPVQQPIYNQHDGEGDFIALGERVIYQLGSGYIGTFLAGGGLTLNTAAVTDKRVYYRGKTFTTFGLGFNRCKATQVIDLKDITGVGLFRAFNIMQVILGVLCLFVSFIPMVLLGAVLLGAICAIISLFIIILAFIGSKTLLRIDSADSFIAMNVKHFSKQECEAFRKNIYLAKDNITNYK